MDALSYIRYQLLRLEVTFARIKDERGILVGVLRISPGKLRAELCKLPPKVLAEYYVLDLGLILIIAKK